MANEVIYRNMDEMKTAISELTAKAKDFVDNSPSGGGKSTIAGAYTECETYDTMKEMDRETLETLGLWRDVVDGLVDFLEKDVFDMEAADAG